MMGLAAMIDALLRDPDVVYGMARDGEKLGKLCGRLLLIFVITAGLYGATMGSFRWLHPEYRFRDFEIQTKAGQTMRGRIAGVNFETGTAYTVSQIPAVTGAEIRFNLSHPTDSYPIESMDDEEEYTAIKLAAGAALREQAAWKLPWLVMLKVPALFLLTLLICAPSLYVLNLALDARMHFMPVMTTASFGLAATGVMLAVIAPIAALFSYVTDDYHFMQCLHVCVFIVAGAFGMRIMYRGLLAMLPDGTARVKVMMLLCLVLYGLVGSQLAWTLKPFLGTPYLPATPPFRIESGNIYVSFFGSMGRWTRAPRETEERRWGQVLETRPGGTQVRASVASRAWDETQLGGRMGARKGRDPGSEVRHHESENDPARVDRGDQSVLPTREVLALSAAWAGDAGGISGTG